MVVNCRLHDSCPHAVADYLEDDVAADMRCVLSNADTVADEATTLRSDADVTGNATAQAIIDQILVSVDDFKDPLNGSALDTIDDAVDEARDAAQEQRDQIDEPMTNAEYGAHGILALLVVLGLINIMLVAGVACDGNNYRRRNRFKFTLWSCTLLGVMWFVLLLSAILFLLLRLEAGFCDKPYPVLRSYLSSDDRTEHRKFCTMYRDLRCCFQFVC